MTNPAPSSASRRRFMSGGAIGLTSIVLPSAVRASSSDAGAQGAELAAVTPDASTVTYASTDVVLARWSGISTGTDSFPKSTSTAATGVTGSLDHARPAYQGFSALNSAGSSAIGLALDVPSSDSRGYWYWRNAATSFSNSGGTTLGTVLPFVAWSVTAPAAKSMVLRSCCFHAFSAGSVSLKHVLTVSSDGHSTVLRTFSYASGQSYWNVVVNLSGVPVVGPGSSIEFRLWMYDGSTTVARTNTASGSSYQGLEGPRDAYDSKQGFGAISILGTLTS